MQMFKNNGSQGVGDRWVIFLSPHSHRRAEDHWEKSRNLLSVGIRREILEITMRRLRTSFLFYVYALLMYICFPAHSETCLPLIRTGCRLN